MVLLGAKAMTLLMASLIQSTTLSKSVILSLVTGSSSLENSGTIWANTSLLSALSTVVLQGGEGVLDWYSCPSGVCQHGEDERVLWMSHCWAIILKHRINYNFYIPPMTRLAQSVSWQQSEQLLSKERQLRWAGECVMKQKQQNKKKMLLSPGETSASSLKGNSWFTFQFLSPKLILFHRNVLQGFIILIPVLLIPLLALITGAGL